ncbi:DUF1740-domain-containing protein [Lindgomyces ingoldianus]|uniref:DUF1740-domain-containing protein n=1 Tax=Lindgomyces ingoldianus TaxID=673940 RepID=A0ACB6QRW2_9PLEO|nr:DUF1740-domain-containing protein [Lindgomyces ingoldianus]KAF2469724.1 DUF1740-domain-containing protein [Lindgomyces ingoldianus]
MNANVPKFASFRPKPKAPAAPPGAPARHEKQERPEKPPNDKKSKSAIPKRRRSRTPERDHGDLYFTDRKGDPANLKYGSLDRRQVPSYRRFGSGFILGVTGDRRIDRSLTTEKEIVLTPPVSNRKPGRLLTSKQAFKGSVQSTHFIKPDANVEPNHDLDYIILPNTRRGRCSSDTVLYPLGVEANYRSISRKSDVEDSSDPDTRYDSDPGTDVVNPEVTERNTVLTKKTREHPESLQPWLDLADHQEAMMRMGRADFSAHLSGSDKRHLADIKISIYEEALKKIGTNRENRVQLQILLMTEASKHWDRGKLVRKWEEIFANHADSLELWIKYLDFVQTSFVSFKYESCRITFSRCLKALRSGTNPISPAASLHLIIRMTSMIRQSGYQELAMAIWQSILEFHLMRPGDKKNEESLRQFEEFWESEVPRIGEVSAKGWRYSDLDGSVQLPPQSPLAYPEKSALDLRVFHMQELECMDKLRYAGRTTDDIGEDDPFHTILFSDLDEYLLCIPQDTPDVLLVGAFLCFCHLPPLARTPSDSQIWRLDPFLHVELLGSRETQCEQSSSFSQALSLFRDSPAINFQMTTELLIDQGFTTVHESFDAVFVQRVLKLLATDVTRDEILGEYLLAFEFKYFPSAVFNTAKQLLKARPTNFRLYNAYGLVESRGGSGKRADNVFRTALSMNKSQIPFAAPGSLQLFDSWVWEALRHGDEKESFWRLVSPKGQTTQVTQGNGKGPDQSTILRAQTVFRDGKDRSLISRDYSSAILFTSLLALLAYLSSKTNPIPALAVHASLSNWFEERKLGGSPMAELHAQAIAKLVTYYASNAAIVKPSFLRGVLEPLITRFPSNTILLSLYAANEARFPIHDRVRTIMYRESSGRGNESTIAAWFFAIHFEMRRSEITGSTGHSIRAIFKRAEEGVGAYCPGLWCSHVLFELEEARREKAKRGFKKLRMDGKKSKQDIHVEECNRRVKETFFQGLTHLPWCKDYMMLGFTHLMKDDILADDELRKIYNILLEKELRIYVDVEESEA